jgi:hypothetical protein
MIARPFRDFTDTEFRIISACLWFSTKWRSRAAEIGVYGAARLMRKQGIPVEVAVSILATR